jgi:hypothetical protein
MSRAADEYDAFLRKGARQYDRIEKLFPDPGYRVDENPDQCRFTTAAGTAEMGVAGRMVDVEAMAGVAVTDVHPVMERPGQRIRQVWK